eukprot:g1538.t1
MCDFKKPCGKADATTPQPSRPATPILQSRSFVPVQFVQAAYPAVALASPRGPLRPVRQEGVQTVPCQAAFAQRKATPQRERTSLQVASPHQVLNGWMPQRTMGPGVVPSATARAPAPAASYASYAGGVACPNPPVVLRTPRAASSSPVRRLVQPPVLSVIYG